ncbi:neutral zinc metallopeptidase [Sphingomonas solaris]|uniref:Zinc metalloprotease n=1 Tax=Alterirhizorhabdus solaris TaxID=2529389 RepID=A0A558QZM5_9SPHN|nr:neutral zinc metallopeptidase [Sphingomonas solaris]TVV72558.1 zinc metalloprotease [Sphingomonas solaris]
MRLDDEQESSNFEVQGRGGGGGGLPLGLLGMFLGSGKLGCGALALIVVAALVFGINPLQLLGGGGGSPVQQSGPATTDPSQLTEVQRLSLKVLGSTERRWTDIFAKSGQQYTPAVLSFYSSTGRSGCGVAQAAMGPFYCPSDNKIYLDTQFFDELRQKYGVPGDFAQAYVIAHEVGHHVQKLTGIADRVRRAQANASEAEGNALQVRMELQADCYAGVWAKNDVNLLEAGDIEEGMRAAQAIGDDTLQQAAGQRPVPESFTHGTSAQRQEWLKRGLDSGDPAQCDTFAGSGI